MPALEVKLPDIKPIITKPQQQMMEIHKTVTEGIYGWEEVTKGFDESLSNFIARSIEAAAEAIGQIIAGDLGFDGLMKAILLQLASFLKQIGAQLIKFGVMIIAFKMALESVLANPWATIAIGAAMVAAAAVMTALINKNAQNNAPKLTRLRTDLCYGGRQPQCKDRPGSDRSAIQTAGDDVRR